MAFVGGGTAETLNPFLGVTPIDESRIQNLYDPLVLVNADLTRSPGLALEWTHNKDATVWEVKLRPGVTFHNGKTFGAEDVIWSIQQMAGKTSAALPYVSGIKLGELKAVNKLTVRIPLKAADADLSGNFTYYNTWIVPKGQTAKDYSKKPVGTGPFMAQSFTPGRQSVFVKNPNYWVSGKPYVDSLKIQNIDDNTARLNALLSGQIDVMAQLPTQQAKAHAATKDITVLRGPVAPGDDVLHGHDEGAVHGPACHARDQADRRSQGARRERDLAATARSATTSSARACRSTTSRCRSASRTSTRPSRCSRPPGSPTSRSSSTRRRSSPASSRRRRCSRSRPSRPA